MSVLMLVLSTASRLVHECVKREDDDAGSWHVARRITSRRMALRHAALRCAALRCAALRCAALRCAALRCATLRCATLRYATLRYALLPQSQSHDPVRGAAASHCFRESHQDPLRGRPRRLDQRAGPPWRPETRHLDGATPPPHQVNSVNKIQECGRGSSFHWSDSRAGVLQRDACRPREFEKPSCYPFVRLSFQMFQCRHSGFDVDFGHPESSV